MAQLNYIFSPTFKHRLPLPVLTPAFVEYVLGVGGVYISPGQAWPRNVTLADMLRRSYTTAYAKTLLQRALWLNRPPGEMGLGIGYPPHCDGCVIRECNLHASGILVASSWSPVVNVLLQQLALEAVCMDPATKVLFVTSSYDSVPSWQHVTSQPEVTLAGINYVLASLTAGPASPAKTLRYAGRGRVIVVADILASYTFPANTRAPEALKDWLQDRSFADLMRKCVMPVWNTLKPYGVCPFKVSVRVVHI
jgi:hypothetical protein